MNQQNKLASGIQILELLLPSRERDPKLHYNLGMAYCQTGRLDEAVKHLERALALMPEMINAKVALGVALSRKHEDEKALEVLRDATLDDPDNGHALRNLGALLLRMDKDSTDALRYLTRATQLLPDDQATWLGAGQAYIATGDPQSADAAFGKAISLNPQSPIAEVARGLRSQIANEAFRRASTSALRMDAVMYCLGALRAFARMTPDEVRKVGFEIATLGMNGIDVNDSKPKYKLRSLNGSFSGLQLVCYEVVAFKQVAPDLDVGFDVEREFQEATRMKAMEA